MKAIDKRFSEIQISYNQQRVEGINEHAPRKGFYKIHRKYTDTLNGQKVTMASASWKLKEEDEFFYIFTAEIIIDSLRKCPSPDSFYFFGGRLVGETVFIKSTAKTIVDGKPTYQIEWEIYPKRLTVERLNEMLNSDAKEDNDLLKAFDESPEVWIDDDHEEITDN